MTQDNVVVVGAGPVGLLLALGLAKAGVEVTVLEREPAVVASPRAMLYHWAVLDGLDRLGVLADAEKAGFAGQGLSQVVFQTGERFSCDLAVLSEHTPRPYNLHLGQDKLAEIALDHLLRLPKTAVRWATRMTGLAQDTDGVTVLAETADGPAEFRADWVVGADGAGSAVRKALGLSFDGMTWPGRFVATNIRYNFADFGFWDANMVIDPKYGAIVAKIDETGLWRFTYCEDAALPDESVLERMPDYFRVMLPGAKDCELVQYSPYRMHQRAAGRMRVGRVLLAGDAAHATNPVGGLGLTSGLFDLYVLHEALAAVIHGEADDEILDRYSAERLRVFWEVTSPAACENKRLIFHSSDPARLEQDLTRLRLMQTDRDALLKRMLFTRKLQTPSLLTGQRGQRRS